MIQPGQCPQTFSKSTSRAFMLQRLKIERATIGWMHVNPGSRSADDCADRRSST
jgi:hypothetical protein